jgi:ribosomal protein S18 acetylase RimI-like enzyme
MAEQKGEVKIRKMAETDLEAVSRIDRSTRGNDRFTTWPFSFDSYWGIYHPDIKLVAEVDSNVVGFVVGTIVQRKESESIFNLLHSEEPSSMHQLVSWMDMIGLDPEHRNVGIGRSLTDAFYQECKRRNAVMRIIAYHNDEKLGGFLESMGFVNSGVVIYKKD